MDKLRTKKLHERSCQKKAARRRVNRTRIKKRRRLALSLLRAHARARKVRP